MRNQVVPNERIVVYNRDWERVPSFWARLCVCHFFDGDLVVGLNFTDGPHGRMLFVGTDRCTKPDGHKFQYPPEESKTEMDQLKKLTDVHLRLVHRDDGFVEHRFTVRGMTRSWLASPNEMISPNYRQRLWNRMSVEEREMHLLQSALSAMAGRTAGKVA